MVQIEKFSKKKAKRVAASARHSSEREVRQDAASMAGIPATERHGEEFAVHEPAEPPRFSSIIDDISLPEEHTPTPEEQTGEISPQTDDFPASLAEDGTSARGKRSQFFPAIPTRQVLLPNPTSPK
jgi:hypothetical protein